MARARMRWWLMCLLVSIGCGVDSVDSPVDEDASGDAEQTPDAATATTSDADIEHPMDASTQGSMDAGTTPAPSPDACTTCQGACVDTQTDPAHCGACDSPCRGSCRAGHCERSCQPALYLVADLSNSMAQQLRIRDAGPSDAGLDAGDASPVNPNTRMEGMKSALLGLLDDPATAEVQLGLGHFPIEQPDGGSCDAGTACTSTSGGVGCCPLGNLCFAGVGCLPIGGATSSCEVADYAKPDIELGPLSSVGPALRSAVAGFKSFGQSPEIPALEGALTYARGKADASRKLSVVLFADGMWTTCGGDAGMGSTQPMAEIAARFAAGSPAVTTYVLGMQGDADAGFFDPVADAGGTGKAYNAASAGEVGEALRAIRDHAAAQCP